MVSENLKIEIRQIPNKKNVREFSKELEYFSQTHTVCPSVDPVTMRYKTGLSEDDIKYLNERGFPYNIDDRYYHGVPHEFWENRLIKVELRNTPIFLYPGRNLIDFIKWKYLLQSKYVYISESEIKEATKPEATHFIYNEEEEVSVKASKIAKKNELIKAVSSLSLDRKRQVVLLINNEDTSTKNESYLDVKLQEFIDSKELSKDLELILSQSKEKLDVRSTIKSAIKKNVLRKTKKGYMYFDTSIGLTEDDVVKFLEDPENQEVFLTIKSKI